MTDEDAVFEDIRALCDEAEALGLVDVALVLEFALDVFLKETGQGAPKVADAQEALERSARKLADRQVNLPAAVPRVGWSMNTFPLAQITARAS